MSGRKKRIRRLTTFQKEAIQAYTFILPVLFGLIVFNIFPIFASAFLSLTDWDGLTQANFIGLGNYQKLFQEELFWTSMKNTLYYTFVNVPLLVAISLGLALLMNSKIRGITFYRTCYYLPTVTSMVAISTVWNWMYNGDYGLINMVLWEAFGIIGPRWLSSTDWAMIALIIMSVWKSAGYYMVIFLAALKGVPEELYEAAEIDGASKWQRTLHITLPMVSPTTFFVLIMALIGSFQMFEQSYVMTSGGPSYSTTTMVLIIFQQAFSYLRMGYASALAWVLFILIMFFSFIQMYFQKKWVHYV